jgi:hypothetical protein
VEAPVVTFSSLEKQSHIRPPPSQRPPFFAIFQLMSIDQRVGRAGNTGEVIARQARSEDLPDFALGRNGSAVRIPDDSRRLFFFSSGAKPAVYIRTEVEPNAGIHELRLNAALPATNNRSLGVRKPREDTTSREHLSNDRELPQVIMPGNPRSIQSHMLFTYQFVIAVSSGIAYNLCPNALKKRIWPWGTGTGLE